MSNGQIPRSDQVVLLVLDGWGYSPHSEGNAIEVARTPTWHRLWGSEARTLLEASGPAVGLPEGQMGNSEVGHLNLGAGRVVAQDIVRIDEAITSGTFFENEALVGLCRGIRERGGTLHLMGLLGFGGVHAIDRHVIACLEMAVRAEVPAIAVHGFLDGRDSPPTSGEDVVRTLEKDLARVTGGRAFIATLTGRYYAMDRDKRWDRTQLAYDAMVDGVGARETDPVTAIRHAYDRGETDEFIRPLIISDGEGRPRAKIRDGDGILCFNFRSDRMRQIVRALVIDGFD